MKVILDQSSDAAGTTLAKFAALYEFPEFVTEATFPDETNVPVAAYADLSGRQFPCHTKAATWLSTLYFLHSRDRMSTSKAAQVDARLQKMADHWGISWHTNTIRKQASLAKNAEFSSLPDSDFAYVFEFENGEKERRLPLRNRVEVEKAAEWLDTYRKELRFEDQQKIAERILEKAAKFDADLGGREDILMKRAGKGICDPDVVATQLRLRQHQCTNAEIKTAVVKLAEAVEKHPEKTLEVEELPKLACMIEEIDRRQGFVNRWDDDRFALLAPESFLFGVTYEDIRKVASEHFTLTTGSIYPVESLEKISLADVRDTLGDDIAEAVSDGGVMLNIQKAAEVAPTLPRPDAELFEGLLMQTGEQPIHKEACVTRVGLTDRQWDELANQSA